MERVKFNILEIQENFENFADKKELTLECLDAVKAHQKLANLGEPLEDYPNIDTEQVDLCRCLYKLHFQLLLLLESYSKLLRLVNKHAEAAEEDDSAHAQLMDRSKEIAEIMAELMKVNPGELLMRTSSIGEI